MSNIAYIRVSSEDQNLDRQREALKKYNIDKWFSEKVSGKNMKDRPELLKMLDYIREGDTVYILDFTRLARNVRDLLQLVDDFQARGIPLVSIKDNLDTSTPNGKLMLTVIAGIGEFERANIKERQLEGIKLAKARGVYKGRQKAKVDKAELERLYSLYLCRGLDEKTGRKVTKSYIAEQLKVSRPTLERIIVEEI